MPRATGSGLVVISQRPLKSRQGTEGTSLSTEDDAASFTGVPVLVDIAVDQGGCFESTHPTTHDDPTFAVHGSVFYCVANMPGAVPVTSTRALTNATLPYLTALADRGWVGALRTDGALARGLMTHAGALCSSAVAESHGYAATPVEDVLAFA